MGLNLSVPDPPANGAFLRSGAHVLNVRCAPVLESHHFRHVMNRNLINPLRMSSQQSRPRGGFVLCCFRSPSS
ncbi:hypothetical protein C3731_16460 [Brucella oryzae]|uniref:Uncharacterized protein n=1 Tax=Brucella oryzae TaxID=335286 RepID=A0A2S7IWW3_9HYPH|nr:hypothetical protein C3731_16460 [Brucella oryzae]